MKRGGAREGRFGRALATLLTGLALIVVLPLYVSFLLVKGALSSVWRAVRALAGAARRALHHVVARHRPTPGART